MVCIPIHIFVLCKGATEETFIKTVLNRYLQEKNIYLTPILLNGVSKYNKIRKELILLCKSNCYVTAMLDYYRLPSDTPNKDCAPNHGFEALLFSNPEYFSFCGAKKNQINQLKNQKEKAVKIAKNMLKKDVTYNVIVK